MHEVSIAEEIKQIVINKLNENNGKMVKKVNLLIGEMTSIVPEALRFAFEIVAKDTPLENAVVNIKISKTIAQCNECKKRFRIRELNLICPKCNSMNIEVIQGREMIIQTIEMET
jgi:hydrogenase nickel incorporation protein HypA/HybF